MRILLTGANGQLGYELQKALAGDALILATARLADCEVVYSEDLNASQDYDGVRVENPFRV